MAIEFLCKRCQSPMRAPPSAAGKHGACPHCETVMEIPVVDLEGQLDKIRLGECIVLVEEGTHHKTADQILIRFCSKILEMIRLINQR
mgnify:CR=1 FL=1